MTPEQLTGKVESHLSSTLVGQKYFLIHPQVASDLLQLKERAAEEGYNLNIASGFRSFERQQTIWNNKMAGKSAILDVNNQPLNTDRLSDEERVFSILKWSALPGGSRHHWGSDFDLFDRNSLPKGQSLMLEPWEYFEGHQSSFYLWLKKNAPECGFYFPYDQDRGGVAIEPWHLSHKEIARDAQVSLTLPILRKQIESSSVIGRSIILSQLETIYNQYIVNVSTR